MAWINKIISSKICPSKTKNWQRYFACSKLRTILISLSKKYQKNAVMTDLDIPVVSLLTSYTACEWNKINRWKIYRIETLLWYNKQFNIPKYYWKCWFKGPNSTLIIYMYIPLEMWNLIQTFHASILAHNCTYKLENRNKFVYYAKTEFRAQFTCSNLLIFCLFLFMENVRKFWCFLFKFIILILRVLFRIFFFWCFCCYIYLLF